MAAPYSHDELLDAVSWYLWKLRTDAGLSYRAFAAKVPMAYSSYIVLENAAHRQASGYVDMRLRTLIRVAAVYDLTVGQLMEIAVREYRLRRR